MEQREWDATGGLRDRLKGEEDKVKMIFYGDDDDAIGDHVEEVADDVDESDDDVMSNELSRKRSL